MSTTTRATDDVASILMRLLCNDEGLLPDDVARYILTRGFSDRDKARMHDLVVRNQDDALSPAEKEEMFAFGEAGSMLTLLKIKARRSLGVKAEMPPIP